MPARCPLAATLALAAGVVAAAESAGFMPDGGRGLFPRAFPDPDAARAALAQDRTAEAWGEMLSGAGLTGPETRTLAAYLSVVAPLPAAAGAADPAAILPPDGRELAETRCQSCHSLFSGYLTQRRDTAGWRAIFKSPFHAPIAMTADELTLFADYSALNMPLRVEDVPPEMRF